MSDIPISRNSHIQVTQAILRAFAESTSDGRQVWYMSLQDCTIQREKTRILGTAPNYYSDNTEDFLKREIEGKVGEVFKLFRKFSRASSKANVASSISKQLGANQEIIKRFFVYSLLRSKRILERIKNQSVYAQFIEGGITPDMVLSLPAPAFMYFADFRVSLCINKTQVEFLIPFSCVYTIKLLNNHPIWVMPISPYCSILLEHKDDFDPDMYTEINNEKIARFFNDSAFESENTLGKRFLAGNLVELQRISSALQEKNREPVPTEIILLEKKRFDE